MSEGEFARGANYLNAVLIFCIVKFSQSNKWQVPNGYSDKSQIIFTIAVL